MPRSLNPVPSPQEVLILQQGLTATDYEIGYGGPYVALAVAMAGGGGTGGSSLQMQAYAGPEESDPTLPANAAYWRDAILLVLGTPQAINLGHRTRVRMVPSGTPAAGTGLFITLKRIPQ